MSDGCVLMNCQYWDGDSLICTSLSDICVYQPDGTEQLQARIAELEQRLAEYGEHTKYCAVMHHPQNTVCTCGWKEIKK